MEATSGKQKNGSDLGDLTNFFDSIPKDWEIVRVGEVFDFTKKPKKWNISEDREVLFIPMEMIPQSGALQSWQVRKKASISSGTFVLKNDILIAKITPCFENGKQARLTELPEEFAFATTEVWPLHPKDERVLSQYFFEFLRLPEVRNLLASKMEGATGRQRLPRYVLESFEIPLPPHEEQKKIAYVLSTIQNSKEKTEKVILSLRELKKSLMEHLFTYGPVSLGESGEVASRSVRIGNMPKNWGLKPLGSLVDVKGGKRLPKGHAFSDKQTDYPYIRVVDFANNSVKLNDLKYLTTEDREKIKRYIITKNDVYLSIAGTIGIVGTIPEELEGSNLTENAARLVIQDKETLNKIFLVYYLSSQIGRTEIELRTTKTSQPKLALTRIKQIPVPVPKLEEQQKIADILSTVDQRIETEEKKKKALEELFKSMLHNLMTAKIRVKNLELEGEINV